MSKTIHAPVSKRLQWLEESQEASRKKQVELDAKIQKLEAQNNHQKASINGLQSRLHQLEKYGRRGDL